MQEMGEKNEQAELYRIRHSAAHILAQSVLEMKVPYMLVVGDREVAEGTVSLRRRDGERLDNLAPDQFIADVAQRIKRRLPGL